MADEKPEQKGWLRDDPENLERLFHEFFEEARRVAKSRIGPAYQSRISATDIALSAMNSALMDTDGPVLPNVDESFRRFLFKIVRNKTISAVRHESADRRDARRTEGGDAFENLAIKQDVPYREDVIAPVAARCVAEMLKEWSGRDNERAGVFVTMLGNFWHLSGPAILKSWEQVFPNDPSPSLRWIQIQVKENWDRIREILSDESGLNE
jgi:DNA-directed RNA polymerase specialized sigma24 family protein